MLLSTLVLDTFTLASEHAGTPGRCDGADHVTRMQLPPTASSLGGSARKGIDKLMGSDSGPTTPQPPSFTNCTLAV
eukprot:CAMPEP_0183468328 /NCGR_PEP_ID=MMETSP0370-20130417/152567_1 /TAXON_ID=268820 /ORGANISM="Peridinium aciculiferum, Strain PAER-2" /LENGTH=75 /DNA_ID=CAMNT_0025660717 /DNA_START=174 /DNA_END=401 /DNA_ORIENTATION=+